MTWLIGPLLSAVVYLLCSQWHQGRELRRVDKRLQETRRLLDELRHPLYRVEYPPRQPPGGREVPPRPIVDRRETPRSLRDVLAAHHDVVLRYLQARLRELDCDATFVEAMDMAYHLQDDALLLQVGDRYSRRLYHRDILGRGDPRIYDVRGVVWELIGDELVRAAGGTRASSARAPRRSVG